MLLYYSNSVLICQSVLVNNRADILAAERSFDIAFFVQVKYLDGHFGSINIYQLAEPFVRRKALRHLEKGRIVIFAGGTGNPFFSTDTAAALRAAEIGADVIFKATNVDGVYDSDPKLNPEAKKYDTLSHIDVLKDGLHVMDSTAASLCMDNSIEILVFNLNDPHNIVKAITGEHIGTIVK